MFDNCSNAVFNDVDWTNIGVGFYGTSSKSSIDARCNPGQAINVTEQFSSGQTLSGASYETDTFNIINWF
jgi:hypothetical protein